MSSHKKYAGAYLAAAMLSIMMADLFLEEGPKALMSIVGMIVAAVFVICVADPDNK